ncbi:MAG TPA: D-arabinono-1,4-lactone oxidase [Flavitalea sp.]|nr:D-arabinono-1,4-lactone oxidase [Flavitalea sp.]
MNRKAFIRVSSAFALAPLVHPISTFAQEEPLKNWSGNLQYSTSNLFYPKAIAEAQKKIQELDRSHVLGTRHCFNTIADSKFNLISSNKLNKVLAIDESKKLVHVQGGIKYGELSPILHLQGYAIHNLASLPHISVAGSISTATHGSGVTNGNLASAVRAIEFIAADGSIQKLSKEKDGDRFNGAVVSLGAIGMITSVSLAIEPTFQVRQHVFLNLPYEALEANFAKIMSAGYSVSLFTNWQSPAINEVWIKSRIPDDKDYSNVKDFFGARAATVNMHPIAELSAENCTPQMGQAGPWYERLPHFKMGFTPSSGKELQAEYFVPLEHAVHAMMAVKKLAAEIGPLLFISEIRTIKGDDFWMSPCRKQDSVAIHFTLKQEWEPVQKLLPKIEAALEPFNPRPHWGKLFTMSASTLASKYDRLKDFRELVAGYDPNGKFRNDFLQQNLYS